MKNKKATISIVLGIMCFALTLGIVIQMKTVSSSNSAVSNNYEVNNLRAEVLKYKERYDNQFAELENAEKELEEARKSSTENDSALAEKEEEIKGRQ